ncbi:MAG: EAL domain-containing protein [Ruminococcus sp.]|nr:EAL domain-containing protein [Ruminococcus sp.]
MDVKRKRIALLAGQADESYQSQFITGFLRNAFSLDLDVCVFSMFRKYQDTAEREKGESNIFTLLEPDMFDGVVVLEDSIQTAGVADELEEKLHSSFRGPVLIIEKDSKYFPSIFTDGYSAVVELVSHLIEVHGCRDIAFLSGKRWHKHSQQRMQAYCDALEQHGIPFSEDRVIYGDFWYQSGELCADLLMDKEPLPDAVVCANDAMAIGLGKALTENGLRIPEDIRIVSYDSTYEGQTSPKSITSSVIPAEEFGSYAAGWINDSMQGRETPPFDVKPHLIVGESCGCSGADMPDFSCKRKEWDTELSEEGFNSVNNTMAEDIMAQTDLLEYLGLIYSYAYQIKGAKSFCLCLCSPWRYMDKDPDTTVFNNGYSDRMICAVKYNEDSKDGLVSTDMLFDREQLLPDLFARSDEPSAYFFLPVFCEDQCFGYAAVSYGSVPRSYGDPCMKWLGLVSRGLESLRRHLALNRTRELLDKLKAGKFAAAGIAYDSLTNEEKKDYNLVGKILDENLLTYHFQPIVNTVDGGIYSYEALMRSAADRKIPPLSIIKYSDMQSRLVDVEKATFLNVLGLVDLNKEKLGKAKIFINSIPGVRVYGQDFVMIEELLRRLSDKVVIELTENSELDDKDLARLKDIFKDLGLEIAVDDYGTGYSNVNNLLRYMPNYVKIDRALLAEIQDKPQKQHFVKEIINFCHDNSIMALAEGVETYDELKTVIRLGADLIQGYYTGRPAPGFVKEIDPDIRDEIKACHQELLNGAARQQYIAGKTNRISLPALVKDGITEIIVGKGAMVYKDIAVIGTPGTKTQVHMSIEPGYTGRITLENVYFAYPKGKACIDIGENADVTLVIGGENILHGSGVRVPKSSRLTFEGDGNIAIQLISHSYFGIGEDPENEHGDLTFEQSGLIEILGRGVTGCCIGSGLGGKIRMNAGQYILESSGNESVCIGALSGSADIEMRDCNVSLEYTSSAGVGAGSLSGDARVSVEKSALMLYGSGHQVAGIGTIGSGMSVTSFSEASPVVALSADLTTGIGSMDGRTLIEARSCSMRIDTSGEKAIAIGGFNRNGQAVICNSDVKWLVNTKLDRDVLIPEDNLKIISCHKRFSLNGKPIER